MSRPLSRWIVLLLAGFLSACGDPTPEAQFPPAGGDPPGTAAKLSLGATQVDKDVGPYQSAVRCSAAIGVVAQFARRMSLADSQDQLKLLDKAADVYRRRAEAAGATGGGSSPVVAAISQATQAVRDDPGAQAQLAMACVRNLGNPKAW